MPLPVTTRLNNWQFQKTHIERNMDSAAYETAHPDDTLLLAGPNRYSDAKITDAQTAESNSAGVELLPIGMVQQMSWQQSKPTQPMMAIGSGRTFFTSGKSQTSWTMSRLLMNGRNLMRVLYQAAVAKGVDPSAFDDKAAYGPTGQFFTNLDSELYHIPFGLGVLFRSKAHDWVGAFYAENCMIGSYSVGLNAGQTMIMEQVGGVADRMLPISLANLSGGGYVPRGTIDAVIGFAAGTGPSKTGGADRSGMGTADTGLASITAT